MESISNQTPSWSQRGACSCCGDQAHQLSPEPDQDGDTKEVNTGDETVDTNVPYESHGCQDTLEEENGSRAKQDVPDAGNHVTKYGDSTEIQDLTSSRASSPSFTKTNLGEETHHPPDITSTQHTTQGKPS